MVSEDKRYSVKLHFVLILMQIVFFPDSVTNWNRIGFEVREITSQNAFKKKILCFLRPQQQSIFGIHDDPIGIKWLFQLRLGLSIKKIATLKTLPPVFVFVIRNLKTARALSDGSVQFRFVIIEWSLRGEGLILKGEGLNPKGWGADP